MGEIKDFQCTYDNSAGISEEVTEKLNLIFPEAYMHWETMAILSKTLKEHDGASFCELPFCHTVEAEALGGLINYGDGRTGPRAKEYRYASVKELLNLPEIDFSQGRIHEVLLACQALHNQGEHVVLMVSGSFTILNVLIDARYVFKAMRKKPEIMKEVFWKLGGEVLKFMKEAQKYGVDMISYADSSGGTNILGPKMALQVVEDFTYEFIKEAEQVLGERTILLLCPKTSLALIGAEKAVFRDVPLSGPMEYGKACQEVIGKVKIAGQMCIKNVHYMLDNAMIKEIKLR